MFGTDTPCNRALYRTYYRFLETDDEYFDSTPSHHLQGFWMIYGVFLPKDVLEKIYYKNAQRLLYFGDETKTSGSGEARNGAPLAASETKPKAARNNRYTFSGRTTSRSRATAPRRLGKRPIGPR